MAHEFLAHGFRALVVDDDEAVNRATCRLLILAGFSVTSAYDGSHALEVLADNSIDLVVSDVDMPGMNGPHLYEVLCEEYPKLRDRFIFMTGNYGVLASLKAPFLLKPCGAEALNTLLRRVIGVSEAAHG